ncbi:UNVERIFIED_CONTAM: COP1-interactive protein 1 [Sesamum indicum]
MAKHRWEGSMKSFRIHIDPEKEEHQKWLRTENENKVKRILKLTKGLSGNKEANSRKKSELISLIEEFQQQYESLYSLYVDLRVQVKANINGGDDDVPSTSYSDSESYFSPDESNIRTSDASSSESLTNFQRGDSEEAETSDVEDTILKDKLTCSSEVKEKATTSNSQSQELSEILKDLTVQDEEVESTRHTLAQTKELEGIVASLKDEVEMLCTQKRRLEEQVEGMSNEAKQRQVQILRLEARILELEAKSKGNESIQISEDNEDPYSSRISNLVAQTNNLQLEANTLEERLSGEASQVKGLTEQVKSLQKELVAVNGQKAELEKELVKKEAEASECLVQIENLKNELKNQVLIEQGRMQEKESLKVQVKDLDQEVYQLSSTKSDLEELLKKINQEADQSKVENEELQRKISELQTSLSSTKNKLSAQEKKFEACQGELSTQIEPLKEKVRKHEKMLETLRNDRKSLQAELERCQKELEREKQEASLSKSQMERKNNELTSKIADQQKTLLELGEEMDKLKAENESAQMRITDSKSNFLLVERKMEEIAEEFRKQYEDKFRILSRRIRVAEQLQAENKEWYMRTKDTFEQENKDLKERVGEKEVGQGSIKDISITANHTLVSLDSVALRFEECTANFLNRISKSSCELKFAKDWVMRKNKALMHVKDDMDCLLHQLDDKEAEILIFREKVWKSENKIRELEKMIKEKEEGMLGLQEEKREAIRQLCVWIDYHRSRSDYYKKMLSEVNRGRRKAA